jgi:glyoxylase-like metal-dependent hydrolase (beta-lactamase superfamily II)
MTFFVEGDHVLFAGDVVMPAFPSVNAEVSSVNQWLHSLDDLESLNPVVIVPAHGRHGGAGMIDAYQAYLTAVRKGARELEDADRSVDDGAPEVAATLDAQFQELRPPGGQPGTGRIVSAVRAAYREAR